MEDKRPLEEFIKDWEIDYKNKVAKHKSGLSIGYDSTNQDGSLRLYYTNIMSWNKSAYSILKSGEKVEEFRGILTKQFVEIYKTKMNVNMQSLLNKENGRTY